MGPNPTRAFVKKNADLVPSGETVLGAVIAEETGGGWRRGMRAAGPVTDAIASVATSASEPPSGEAESWPAGPAYWLILTDRQLHVWQGQMGVSRAGPDAAHYPLDRVAAITVDRKLMISKLQIRFTDGTGVNLDLAKQNLKPFTDAVATRLPVC